MLNGHPITQGQLVRHGPDEAEETDSATPEHQKDAGRSAAADSLSQDGFSPGIKPQNPGSGVYWDSFRKCDTW